VLDDISLDLDKGKIYALMGVNGSGKSTLFNIITGFIKPQSGRMYYGEEKVPLPFGKGLGVGIMARTFQDLRVITKLTVKENVLLAIRNNPTQFWYKALLPSIVYRDELSAVEEKAERTLTSCFLQNVRKSLAGEISYGEQKLLNLACCIANDASLLLLDEPVAGINPEYIKRTLRLLKHLKAQGKTIFLIEHNTDFLQQVADHFFFLKNGKLHSYETFDRLKTDKEVLEAYI
jgi:branched-chain amino acid transport system ATP-binding protein